MSCCAISGCVIYERKPWVGGAVQTPFSSSLESTQSVLASLSARSSLYNFFSQPRYFWFFFLKPSLKQSGHLNTRPNIQLYSSRDCQPGAVISLLTRSCKSSLPILSLLSQWRFIHRVQSISSQMQATTRPAKDHCTTREKVCGWLWVYVAEKIPFPLPWQLRSKLVAWGGGGSVERNTTRRDLQLGWKGFGISASKRPHKIFSWKVARQK